jgi:hypothetical protein
MGMQDIDFDEIDRAVSSITNPKTMIDTKVSEPTMPDVTTTLETPVLTPAVRRSSGRFMDVVHPSSDMRPSPLSAPSASSLHREDVTQRTEVVNRPEPLQASSSTFHWPDPIDLVAPTAEPAAETPNLGMTTEPLFEQEEIIEPIAAVTPTEPIGSLESPFLIDTKVEKRPLGAFSGADAGLPLIEDPIPGLKQTESLAEVADIAEVPPELHEAVLLLDAHSEDDAEVKSEAEEPKIDEINIDAIESTAVAPELEIPSGPTSITQQYKEQPSSASQSTSSTYDTEAYYQPLTKPVKKRSGLLIVVWIIALILVGGGIGAALYFIVLPLIK